jgi:hypothetical protein
MVAGRPLGLLVMAIAYAAGGLAVLLLLADGQADLTLRGAIAVYAIGVGLGLLSLTRVGWWVAIATTGLVGFVACAGVIWGLLLLVAAGPSSSVVAPLVVAVVTAACAVWAYNYLWGTVQPQAR